MTSAKGFRFGETHLMPDAVVAFVDEELSPTATQRARAHLAKCASCAAETAAQRQARNEVRSLRAPGMPAGLLAALRDIPNDAEIPELPDGLAMTASGQLVAVQRPERAAAMLSRSAGPAFAERGPLGTGAAVLGAEPGHPNVGKRAAQGAGVLVSGLMLGALALAVPHVSAQPVNQGPQQGGAPLAGVQASLGGAGALNTARPVGDPLPRGRAIHGMMLGLR